MKIACMVGIPLLRLDVIEAEELPFSGLRQRACNKAGGLPEFPRLIRIGLIPQTNE